MASNRPRQKLVRKQAPGTRVLAVATVSAGEAVGSLVKQKSEWVTEFRDPAGELVGRIRTGYSRRVYDLLGDQDQAVGTVTGDLALKHFSVAVPGGGVVARVRKTWAGFAKEMLTPNDHYTVEFTGPVPEPVRTLTAMLPIVLDLNLYEPDSAHRNRPAPPW